MPRRSEKPTRLRPLQCNCNQGFMATPVLRLVCDRPVIDYSQAGQMYAVHSIADQFCMKYGLQFFDLLPDSRGMSVEAKVRTLVYQECFRVDLDDEAIAMAFGREVTSVRNARKRFEKGHRVIAPQQRAA